MGVKNIHKVNDCLKAAIFNCNVDLKSGLMTQIISAPCVNKSCNTIQTLTVKDILYQSNK